MTEFWAIIKKGWQWLTGSRPRRKAQQSHQRRRLPRRPVRRAHRQILAERRFEAPSRRNRPINKLRPLIASRRENLGNRVPFRASRIFLNEPSLSNYSSEISSLNTFSGSHMGSNNSTIRTVLQAMQSNSTESQRERWNLLEWLNNQMPSSRQETQQDEITVSLRERGYLTEGLEELQTVDFYPSIPSDMASMSSQTDSTSEYSILNRARFQSHCERSDNSEGDTGNYKASSFFGRLI